MESTCWSTPAPCRRCNRFPSRPNTRSWQRGSQHSAGCAGGVARELISTRLERKGPVRTGPFLFFAARTSAQLAPPHPCPEQREPAEHQRIGLWLGYRVHRRRHRDRGTLGAQIEPDEMVVDDPRDSVSGRALKDEPVALAIAEAYR